MDTTGFELILAGLGIVLGIFAIITWVLLFETLIEARAHFRRQNANGAVEDAAADEWERQHGQDQNGQ